MLENTVTVTNWAPREIQAPHRFAGGTPWTAPNALGHPTLGTKILNGAPPTGPGETKTRGEGPKKPRGGTTQQNHARKFAGPTLITTFLPRPLDFRPLFGRFWAGEMIAENPLTPPPTHGHGPRLKGGDLCPN
ncbi:MAG: hypothetical protein CM15mP125_3520 [Gammaproteobacteria bacterium]|nr:MAG: hypothetical protein CM15mP125_3520 [Gammaproteobacteria bacterium]